MAILSIKTAAEKGVPSGGEERLLKGVEAEGVVNEGNREAVDTYPDPPCQAATREGPESS